MILLKRELDAAEQQKVDAEAALSVVDNGNEEHDRAEQLYELK